MTSSSKDGTLDSRPEGSAAPMPDTDGGRRVLPDHRRDAGEGVQTIANQDESGRNRNERQEHDRRTRSFEETTGNPYHLSRAARMVAGVVAVIVVIAVTLLFLSGAIRW